MARRRPGRSPPPARRGVARCLCRCSNCGRVLATLANDPLQYPSGIFTGPDPAADKVIASGDALFGSTAEPNSLKLGGINESGQIAFAVSLQAEEPTFALVRTDPVPEPANAPADAIALVALARVCRRRAPGTRISR